MFNTNKQYLNFNLASPALADVSNLHYPGVYGGRGWSFT